MPTPWPDLAIAAVTQALKDRLQRALNASELNGQVRTDKPDKITDVTGPVINLYLYQTAINPFTRNDDLLPDVVRGADGGAVRLVQTWRVPLGLHYLLSFYGNEQKQEPQRLLSITLAVLHRHPIIDAAAVRQSAQALPPAALQAAVDAAPVPAPAPGVGDVRLSIADLGLDDIYRLWSVFKASFALSLGCLAETVVVQSAPEEDEAWLVERLDLHVGQDPGLRSVRVELTNAGSASLWLESAAPLSGRWEAGREPADWSVIGARNGRASWCVHTDDGVQPAEGRVELGGNGAAPLVFRFRNPVSGSASCTVEGGVADVRRANPDDRAHPVFLVRLGDPGA